MDDSFPEQLAEATSTFPNKVTAFAQFRAGVHYIDLHIQAPTIMMQFVGSVQFEAGSTSSPHALHDFRL
jgi:hypothetical protein